MYTRPIALKLSRYVAPALFLVGGLAVWQLVVTLLSVPEYLLPGPSAIGATLYSEWRSLVGHLTMTMVEALLGYCIAGVLGYAVAVVFAHSPLIERGLYPYAIALKTTPVVAMAPLLVVWLGTGVATKVAASALICFFPVLVNSVKGLRTVAEEAVDLFASLGATRSQ
ncbi:ABC transporter permease, partial [Candidatus Peregrinibacteria bacterium CG10_big_fil_rev_8_21_14_0_10_54_7]